MIRRHAVLSVFLVLTASVPISPQPPSGRPSVEVASPSEASAPVERVPTRRIREGRVEYRPLVCKGDAVPGSAGGSRMSLVVSKLPWHVDQKDQYSASFVFVPGRRAAGIKGENLTPGECSWVDGPIVMAREGQAYIDDRFITFSQRFRYVSERTLVHPTGTYTTSNNYRPEIHITPDYSRMFAPGTVFYLYAYQDNTLMFKPLARYDARQRRTVTYAPVEVTR